MNEIIGYADLYPEMPFEIMMFFSGVEKKDNRLIHKTVFQFCEHYQKKYSTKDFPQPRVVANMCEILSQNKKLSVIKRDGIDNMDNSYFCVLKDPTIRQESVLQFYYKKKLNYLVYGFKYIYEDYKKYVVPIEFTGDKGDKSLGTGFVYNNGIVTAKHCIEGATHIAIKGITKELLANAAFEISPNPLLDLLYIRFNQPITDCIMFSQAADVLDEVMTLGFPKIPGYHNFLAAENAIVSSRYTTSVGQIVAHAEDVWMKEKLFLITAKIKGGNSGGPVIAKNGSVVGVSVNLSEGDGDYDDLGYGTVIPIRFVEALISATERSYLDTGKIEFLDFELPR